MAEGPWGGYDAAFVEPLDKDYVCPVCQLAVRHPVQTGCGHTFCKVCIHTYISTARQGRGHRGFELFNKHLCITYQLINDKK
jgi:hypothetical protein